MGQSMTTGENLLISSIIFIYYTFPIVTTIFIVYQTWRYTQRMREKYAIPLNHCLILIMVLIFIMNLSYPAMYTQLATASHDYTYNPHIFAIREFTVFWIMRIGVMNVILCLVLFLWRRNFGKLACVYSCKTWLLLALWGLPIGGLINIQFHDWWLEYVYQNGWDNRNTFHALRGTRYSLKSLSTSIVYQIASGLMVCLIAVPLQYFIDGKQKRRQPETTTTL